MEFTEKMVSSKQVFKGKMIGLRVDNVELPNGNIAVREWVQHPGAVAVIAVDHDNRVCMVRQYRYPIGDDLLEIPAGKLEVGEDLLESARRELLEETGYSAGKWEKIFTYYSTPGFCDEVLHLFLATGLSLGESHPDEDEILEAEMVSLDDALKMMANGEIKDSKTLIGILWLSARLIGSSGGI